jgi:hypothetical protein
LRHAVYDVSVQPITFDILPFIATIGADDGPVHFVILADRFREKTTKDRALTDAQKMWRVHHILAPSCWLLPATAAVTVVTDPLEASRWRLSDAEQPNTFLAKTLERYREDKDIWRFRAPESALTAIGSRFDGAVVITIRQSPIVQEKNCRLSAWLAAIGHMRKRGHRVVLIPDTSTVLNGAPLAKSYEWYPPAALDVGLRAALYERSSLSMSMGAGPAHIPMFMPASRYVMFLHHRGLALSSQQRSFEKVWGVNWGDQMPFDGGRLEYRHDDESAICEAFDKVME